MRLTGWLQELVVDAFLRRITEMRAGRLPSFVLAVGDDRKNDQLFNVSA